MLTEPAIFSPDRAFRYTLRRVWGDVSNQGFAAFVGLNPSTADEVKNDPTVRRCIQYAKDWGYGGMFMLNIFAYRATDPKVMKQQPEPIGPDNDYWLQTVSREAAITVAAWGTHGDHLQRGKAVKALLPNLHYLRLTQDGSPGHPLYLPKNLTPTPF